MPSKPTSNPHKRKPWTIPETASSTNDQNPKASKARRVSTNASASTATSLTIDTPVATEKVTAANTASAAAKHEKSMRCIGALVQGLFHSDDAKVTAALGALTRDLAENKNKCDKIQAVGGCLALVQLVKDCLKKATEKIPDCHRVTDLYPIAEVKTLVKTFSVIVALTFNHNESKVGIAAIGGVEAIVKAMKTFPNCQTIQEFACIVVSNLACCSIGKTKVVETGGIEVLLAAINNHLDSADVCETASWALSRIAEESKENTKLLINRGGAAVVAKVREEWPDSNYVQMQVRRLAKSIGTEINSWADEE
jgi:hypothetical protein